MPEHAEISSNLTTQDSRGASLAGIALLAVGLMTLAVAETLSNPALNNAGWISALDVFVIGVTVATGVYARRRTPANNFGILLILSGLLWGIAALTAATSPVLHSFGRVAQWPAELTILYLVLSYPTGSLKTQGARVVFYAGVALVALLYVPTIFFVSSFDHPFPLESCANGCPPNAFMLTASEPGVIGSVISPLRDILATAVYAAAIGVLALRLRSTSPALAGPSRRCSPRESC